LRAKFKLYFCKLAENAVAIKPKLFIIVVSRINVFKYIFLSLALAANEKKYIKNQKVPFREVGVKLRRNKK